VDSSKGGFYFATAARVLDMRKRKENTELLLQGAFYADDMCYAAAH
jgi:hypothetical protein